MTTTKEMDTMEFEINAAGDPIAFLLVRGYDEQPVSICLKRAGAESAMAILNRFSTDQFAIKEIPLLEALAE